jgi:hypothetical protein
MFLLLWASVPLDVERTGRQRGVAPRRRRSSAGSYLLAFHKLAWIVHLPVLEHPNRLSKIG